MQNVFKSSWGRIVSISKNLSMKMAYLGREDRKIQDKTRKTIIIPRINQDNQAVFVCFFVEFISMSALDDEA